MSEVLCGSKGGVAKILSSHLLSHNMMLIYNEETIFHDKMLVRDSDNEVFVILMKTNANVI